MLDPQTTSFLALAAVLTLTPGADTMLTLRNAAAHGTRAGVMTALGVGAGFFVQPLLAALGVAAIFVRSEAAFGAVKWAGAAYLTWLGLQSVRAAWRGGEGGAPVDVARDGRASFRQGLLTNALNPKIAVFYVAVLPQFIRPGDRPLPRALALAGTHYVMGFAWLVLLSVAAGRASGFLRRRRVRASLDAASGLVMIGLGVRLALSRAAR